MTSLYAFFHMRNYNDNYNRGLRRWTRSPFDQNEFKEGHCHEYIRGYTDGLPMTFRLERKGNNPDIYESAMYDSKKFSMYLKVFLYYQD